MASSGISEDGDAGFQIAPIVDVVFVLLLFFMASAGSQIVEKNLNISLPSSLPSGRNDHSKVEMIPIILDIGPDGLVQANTRVFDSPTSKDLPELKAWLQDTIAKFGDKDPFIIRPTPQTRHERIIDVLNAAAAAGVKNLTFS